MDDREILRKLGNSPSAPENKLTTLRFSPQQHKALTEDGSAQYGLLIEALIPDHYEADRAKAIAEGIRARIARLKSGDVGDIEADLTAQCAWLVSLTAYFTQKAAADSVSTAAADVYWRLALKAQQAYARTAAALVVVLERRGRLASE